MAYTTLAALKSFGGFTEDDHDVILSAMIGTAQTIIEDRTKRVFEVADETDQDFSRVRGIESNRFSGNTLYFYTELADEASAITDSPTVIYLPENGPPYYGCYKTDGAWAYPTVTVTGYWGVSKTASPTVEITCLKIALWLYESTNSTSGGAVVVTPEGQVLLPKGLPNDIEILLAPLKKVVVV